MSASTGEAMGGVARAGQAAGHAKSAWKRVWEERWAYIFVLPKIISFAVFFAYPAIFAFYTTFYRFDNFNLMPLKHPLYNYRRALRDPTLRRAFLNVIELFLITLIRRGKIRNNFAGFLESTADLLQFDVDGVQVKPHSDSIDREPLF